MKSIEFYFTGSFHWSHPCFRLVDMRFTHCMYHLRLMYSPVVFTFMDYGFQRTIDFTEFTFFRLWILVLWIEFTVFTECFHRLKSALKSADFSVHIDFNEFTLEFRGWTSVSRIVFTVTVTVFTVCLTFTVYRFWCAHWIQWIHRCFQTVNTGFTNCFHVCTRKTAGF